MAKVLVVSEDMKDVEAAVEKHGVDSVIWAVRESVERRHFVLKLGLDRYCFMPDALPEDYETVVDGKSSKKAPAKKADPTPAPKKAEAKGDE